MPCPPARFSQEKRHRVQPVIRLKDHRGKATSGGRHREQGATKETPSSNRGEVERIGVCAGVPRLFAL